MNINDFEKYIESKILSRGREYYSGGSVISLDYDEDGGEWTAEVTGSDDYEVTVKLNENSDIISSYCDCPYDFGPYCKHQAAVFYAVRENLNKTPSLEKAKKTPQKSKTLKFGDILNKIEKDELIPFLTEYAAKNKQFKNEFMLNFSDKFADKSDILTYAQSLVKSAFTGYVHSGYIEYHDSSKVVKGAEKVLEMAQKEKNLLTAVKLCIIVLEEMTDANEKYVDEAGYIYGTIEQSAEVLDEIFSGIESDESNKELTEAFDLLMNYISGSEMQLDILSIFVPFCNIKYIREKLEKTFESILSKSVSSYDREKIEELQYEIIAEFDGGKSEREFIDKHLDNHKLRETAVEYAVKEKRFEEAVKLCLDGENKSQKQGYYGITASFKNLRYKIYEESGDIAGQKKLAYEFTLGGEFDYYLKLRKLYTSESEDTGEWHQIFDKILEAVNQPYAKNIYPKILIYENMKPELLQFCQQYDNTVTEYYPHLIPDYPEEVSEIFKGYINNQARLSSDRSQYKSVCGIIKEYEKACGSENAAEIIRALKTLYVKRPAFIDELGKVQINV